MSSVVRRRLTRAPDIEPFEGMIAERVLLHHDRWELERMVSVLGKELLCGPYEVLGLDDFPIINITYGGVPVTLATTRMGTEMTAWIMEQLVSCGARYFVKVGTFAALDEAVPRGSVRIPEAACVTDPGLTRPYAGDSLQAEADADLRSKLRDAALPLKPNGGRVLTFPWIRWREGGQRWDYEAESNPQEYFGVEMECASAFAVAQALGVACAAILICNRDRAALLGLNGSNPSRSSEAQGECEDAWRGHRRSGRYRADYDAVMKVALDALLTCGRTAPGNLVGILGPRRDWEESLFAKNAQQITEDVAAALLAKGYEPLLVPTKGSAPERFGRLFRRKEDKGNLWGMEFHVPPEFQAGWPQNESLCPNKLRCPTWHDQPREIIRWSRQLVCLGICVGAVWEMCLTKYYWPEDDRGRILVLIDDEDERLPPRLNNRLGLEYATSVKELQGLLRGLPNAGE